MGTITTVIRQNVLSVTQPSYRIIVRPAATINTGGGGSTAWDDVTGKPAEFPPEDHTHAIADVTGLQGALDGKATAAQGELADTALQAGAQIPWTNVTGKPDEFPPSTHSHSEVTAGGAAGFMSGADKTKLNGIETGAQANVDTDLTYTAATRVLASSTGDGVTLPLVSPNAAGLAPKIEAGINRFYAFDDMVQVLSYEPFTTAQSGTGAGVTSVAPPTDGLGWLNFNLGTTTTGRVARHLTITAMDFANGPAEYCARGRIPTLSDGTNTYTSRIGFFDNVAGESTDGAFFRYTHGTNGGRFQAVTRANSVETAVDTGIAAATGQTFKFTIEVDASVPEAVFTIDGVVVATITTNIPTSVARVVGAGIMGLKSAGTTATTFWLGDYHYVEQVLAGRT